MRLRPTDPRLPALPRCGVPDRAGRPGAGSVHGLGHAPKSFACSSEDPISGGRHKVLGIEGAEQSRRRPRPSPATCPRPSARPMPSGAGASTPARACSQCPKTPLSMCSFGDASANHSTAQGAFNTAVLDELCSRCPCRSCSFARITASASPPRRPRAGLPSQHGPRAARDQDTSTPTDWTSTTLIRWRAEADGLTCARRRKPAFLHLRTVRLYGHAGADVATTYLPQGRG